MGRNRIVRSLSAVIPRAVCVLGLAIAIAWTPGTGDGFAVFGDEGVWLQINSRVLGGDVGVNNPSSGPYLTGDAELTVGPGSRVMSPSSLVIGNGVELAIGSQIHDVHANDVGGIGAVLGSWTTPLTFPVVDSLPSVPTVVPGPDDVDVPLFSTATLDAGAYGALDVGPGASLTLTGGVYEFASLTVGNSARLLFSAPCEVRVEGRLLVDHIARVEPSEDADRLTAADMLIVVTGSNGATGGIDELPQAASFGQATMTRALVYAPNGTVEMQQNSDVVGSLIGRWVIVGPGSRVDYEGGFDLPLVAGGGLITIEAKHR